LTAAVGSELSQIACWTKSMELTELIDPVDFKALDWIIFTVNGSSKQPVIL